MNTTFRKVTTVVFFSGLLAVLACGDDASNTADAGPDIDNADGGSSDGDRPADAGAQDGSTPTAMCGNATPESGEECDDGNDTDGDGCDSNCTVTACGNGIKTGTEDCDDGNLIDGDDCDSNCTATGCGNGIATDGEECDDGNLVDTDTCLNSCTAAFCGDGFVNLGRRVTSVELHYYARNCYNGASLNFAINGEDAAAINLNDAGVSCDCYQPLSTTGPIAGAPELLNHAGPNTFQVKANKDYVSHIRVVLSYADGTSLPVVLYNGSGYGGTLYACNWFKAKTSATLETILAVEQCDDGNTEDADLCTNGCLLAP